MQVSAIATSSNNIYAAQLEDEVQEQQAQLNAALQNAGNPDFDPNNSSTTSTSTSN